MIPTISSPSHWSIIAIVIRCIFLCSLPAANLVHADDRFVSPDGNDSNNGLTAQTAFRTLAAAAKSTPAGAHIIRMAAGDYPESETTLLAPG